MESVAGEQGVEAGAWIYQGARAAGGLMGQGGACTPSVKVAGECWSETSKEGQM